MVLLLLCHRARRAGCYAAASLLRPVVRVQRGYAASPALEAKEPSNAAEIDGCPTACSSGVGAAEYGSATPRCRSGTCTAIDRNSVVPSTTIISTLTGFSLCCATETCGAFSAQPSRTTLTAGAAVDWLCPRNVSFFQGCRRDRRRDWSCCGA